MKLLEWLSRIFLGTQERASPSDFFPINGIWHDSEANLIIISLGSLKVGLTKPPKVWIPEIPHSNSMDPVFDAGNNNILMAGATTEDHKLLLDYIKPGDIVAAYSSKRAVLHRIVEIGQKDGRRYWRTRGDNNNANDPERWGDEHIMWISVGTIY